MSRLCILHNWSKWRKYLPLSGLFHRVHCTQIWWYYFSLTIFRHHPFSAHHCPSCQHWYNQSSPSPFSWNSLFHIFGNTKRRHSWVEENITKHFKLKEHYTVKIKLVEIKKWNFKHYACPGVSPSNFCDIVNFFFFSNLICFLQSLWNFPDHFGFKWLSFWARQGQQWNEPDKTDPV